MLSTPIFAKLSPTELEAFMGKLTEKAISKRLDSVLKKKEALDKQCEEYASKGGAAYLAKKKEELAAMLG